MANKAHHGWESSFPEFRDAETKTICFKLEQSVNEPGESQLRAWKVDVPKLKIEIGEILEENETALSFSTILEYELPMESRRPDVIFLINGAVVVLELKGKTSPSQADIDQVSAYARDLRCYHRDCENLPVHAVLVPTRASGYIGNECGVDILGPDTIDQFINKLDRDRTNPPVPVNNFLAVDAYRPLPTLVAAARELFQRGDIRPIHRAHAATDPAVQTISKIIHHAAKTSTRHLILLTGVPGAGKTLVGLRIAHTKFLEDLVVERKTGVPTVPAVYLSGNASLVEVLQYELRGAGGGGKTFVRGVKEYVKKYSKPNSPIPPEHVLIFDEAQRAWDKNQVQAKHAGTPGFESGKSEPEHFIQFANRIPQWSVVIGLIGGGQEIYVGEEGGIGQWKDAILGVGNTDDWTVHGPTGVKNSFTDPNLHYVEHPNLNLDREIRFHFASNLHCFVSELLDRCNPIELHKMAISMEEDGYVLRITRDLSSAEGYLRERYAEAPECRFGLLASSRDKSLVEFGIKNDYMSTLLLG